MSKEQNVFIAIFAILIAACSLFAISILIDPLILDRIMSSLVGVRNNGLRLTFYTLVFVCLFLFSSFVIWRSILRSSQRSARLKQADAGRIEVSMNALESIALNAAKTAQAGIKSAKASAKVKDRRVSLYMDCDLYADVEIPTQMEKIQERIKKEIERYTGLSVTAVQVRVHHVDRIGVQVDR